MDSYSSKGTRASAWAYQGAVLGALLLAGGSTTAAEFWLCAETTTLVMPDTNEQIPMWAFARDENSDLTDGCGGQPEVPGPLLTVPDGDTGPVTVHVLNNLTEPVSVVVPGQVTAMAPVRNGDGRVRSFTHETPANGGTASYTWNNFKSGTFIYHSGTHPAVQVQMGLYGGVKKDAAPGEAYPGIPYNDEVILYYSEIDPALHSAVVTGNYGSGGTVTSTIDYRPRYFLVNGQPFSTSTTPAPLSVEAGPRVLIRAFNAGLQTHVPVLQGFQFRAVAEDGNPYPYTREQYSMMLAALKTRDAIVTLQCSADHTVPPPGDHAVYDRRLRLTNAGLGDGGMFSYFRIADSDSDTIASLCDNCSQVANTSQLDSDNDNYGNRCDADLNNDGVTDASDYVLFRSALQSGDPNADLSADGIVDISDFLIFRQLYGKPPGPSGLAP